jgi:hypothetical protein
MQADMMKITGDVCSSCECTWTLMILIEGKLLFFLIERNCFVENVLNLRFSGW